MNFEAVIGLEIHLQVKTKSKMFSSAPTSFGMEANTSVAPLDIAYPGAMPVVNKQAVIHAIRLANSLHMKIDDELHFDRKNYFYSDLSKGYQITQKRRPLGKDGYLEIDNKTIGIEKLQIEEDTCKQVHYDKYTLLDFNRAGIPLLEIVSLPEISNGLEAKQYVEKLRNIAVYLGVSDGKMEEGSLRCDVNISLRPIGSKKYGNKVEIKNINTLNNIQKAVDYEIKRQESLLLLGKSIKQETLRYDEASKKTIPMRIKMEAVDYKYFPDPNILPIKLSKEFIEDAISSSPESIDEKVIKYENLGLNDYQIKLLLYNKDNSEYYDLLIADGCNPVLAANWVIKEVQTILNKSDISIKEFSVSPSRLASLINLISHEKLSNQIAKEIFNKMLMSEETAIEIYQSISDEYIKDEDELNNIVREVIENNPKSVIDYKNGKDKVVKYLMGQVMTITKGKVDPSLVQELIIKTLKEK